MWKKHPHPPFPFELTGRRRRHLSWPRLPPFVFNILGRFSESYLRSFLPLRSFHHPITTATHTFIDQGQKSKNTQSKSKKKEIELSRLSIDEEETHFYTNSSTKAEDPRALVETAPAVGAYTYASLEDDSKKTRDVDEARLPLEVRRVRLDHRLPRIRRGRAQ